MNTLSDAETKELLTDIDDLYYGIRSGQPYGVEEKIDKITMLSFLAGVKLGIMGTTIEEVRAKLGALIS